MKGCSVSQYLLQYCKKQEVEETDNVENNQDDESNEQDEDADGQQFCLTFGGGI